MINTLDRKGEKYYLIENIDSLYSYFVIILKKYQTENQNTIIQNLASYLSAHIHNYIPIEIPQTYKYDDRRTLSELDAKI